MRVACATRQAVSSKCSTNNRTRAADGEGPKPRSLLVRGLRIKRSSQQGGRYETDRGEQSRRPAGAAFGDGAPACPLPPGVGHACPRDRATTRPPGQSGQLDARSAQDPTSTTGPRVVYVTGRWRRRRTQARLRRPGSIAALAALKKCLGDWWYRECLAERATGRRKRSAGRRLSGKHAQISARANENELAS